jgi:CheY-like chemotaxis protein/two-component sensor histidine kinase
VVSHELRTPLNPILGWSKLLQQGRLKPEKTKHALEAIARNAELQSQLIDDLLDISRILRGKLSLNVVAVDLRSVIAAALETVRLAAEAKALPMETIATADCTLVMGDAGRLQQVVWNLLSNAVKFTPQGGQITVILSQVNQQAQIQVSDTGKGIQPQFLPYVFEHFLQEDGAITRQFGGLGLGLAIARQIVELHGGQIGADSPGENQGATFTVILPLATAINPFSPDSPNHSDPSIDNLNHVHIFVIDDETDSREFITFVLEQAGAIVTPFSSGLAALQSLEQAKPDLIICDIGMPEMDGYMLLQQIRALPAVQSLPAIALTAYAGEFDRQQALKAGFQRHLAKPVAPDRLVAAAIGLVGIDR